MGSFDLPSIRAVGLKTALDAAMARLASAETEGFLIHLDADVLDDAVMPAVDYRIEGGLSPAELGRVLERALAGGRAIGLELAIYNPSRDADGSAGRRLARLLTDALVRAAAPVADDPRR
jgi:arginase